MKKSNFIFYSIIFFFVQNIYAQSHTIAVIYFENNSVVDKEKLEPLSKGLIVLLSDELAKIEEIKVIDYKQVALSLASFHINEIESLDKTTLQKIGHQLNAEILVMGGFSNLFGDKFRIDIRIVKTETGEIIKTDEQTCEQNDFFILLQLMVKKIVANLNIRLTSMDKERLENSKEGKFESYILYSQGVEQEEQGYLLEKSGYYYDAAQIFENAKTFYQQASKNYAPAQTRIEQVNTNISNLKRK